MPAIDRLSEENLDIYVSYERLTAVAFGEFARGIGDIGDAIRNMHAELSGTAVAFVPELEVESVHTGESITFKFSERWVPSVSMSRSGEIVIDVPRKIGIPLLVGYLFLTAAEKVEGLYNTHLDNQVKAIELQLKRTELQKTVMESSATRAKLQEEASRVLNVVIQNNDFHVVQVNGATIVSRIERSAPPDAEPKP